MIEQPFHFSIKIVWSAITELNQMKQWFFENIPSFKPEVGFDTGFIVENEGRVFPHLWKITEVAAPKKITYSWSYEGYPGKAFVTFELDEINNGTKLTLTNSVTESFPEDIPEFTLESCRAGWIYFIQQRLKAYLENSV